ncbi:hypothetical protein [Acidithiobacillus sp.]
MKREAYPKPFDPCNYATSGLGGGYCAQHESRIQEGRRQQKINDWEAHWARAQIEAFQKLGVAAHAFAETVGDISLGLVRMAMMRCTDGVCITAPSSVELVVKVWVMAKPGVKPSAPALPSYTVETDWPDLWENSIAILAGCRPSARRGAHADRQGTEIFAPSH